MSELKPCPICGNAYTYTYAVADKHCRNCGAALDGIDILRSLIDKYGDAQLIVAIEELSELQKELTKYLRGKGDLVNIAEEIADVEIMLAQVRMITGVVQSDIGTWCKAKVGRIKELVGNKSEKQIKRSSTYDAEKG